MDVGVVGDFARHFAGFAAGYCFNWMVDRYRKRSFWRTFGQGVRKPGDIVISVGLWTAIEGDRCVPRFFKEDGLDLRQHYGPSRMYNVGDMGAAASVLSIVANHFPGPTTYTNDEDQTDWNAKTVIMIGTPVANVSTGYYLRRYAEQSFAEGLPSFEDMSEDATNGARYSIRIPGKTADEDKFLKSSARKDYGMIVRLPNIFAADGRFFVFLLAGIHDASTREAGRLLHAQWATAFPAEGMVALVFEMEPGMPGTGRIIHQVR
jgi:hypothetical protein